MPLQPSWLYVEFLPLLCQVTSLIEDICTKLYIYMRLAWPSHKREFCFVWLESWPVQRRAVAAGLAFSPHNGWLLFWTEEQWRNTGVLWIPAATATDTCPAAHPVLPTAATASSRSPSTAAAASSNSATTASSAAEDSINCNHPTSRFHDDDDYDLNIKFPFLSSEDTSAIFSW